MEMEISFEGENNKKRKRSEESLLSIGYVVDEHLLREASKLPNVKGRAVAVHRLIESYDLLRNVTIYKSTPATEDEISNFHSRDYVSYLQKINNTYTPEDDVELECGLGYDCPPLDGIYDYCCAIAGSSLTAARALINKEVDVAVNWCGGWHHAQRYEAEGFCYVNDIVLAILELRSSFNQILYVDLDVHHGNGVETCFECTKRVLTLSFHQFESGFYPGTGSTLDVGTGYGKYYTVNVPLKEGVADKNYINVFDRVLDHILKRYTVDAIVVQCGADGLAGDPLGGFNLTEKSYGHCLRRLLDLEKPSLVLGGGGYNIPNTSRCWTYLTSVIIGNELSTDIPEHELFSLYGPSYELTVTPSNRKDFNDQKFINKVLEEIEKNLEFI